MILSSKLSRRRFITITAGATLGTVGAMGIQGASATSALTKTSQWRGVALGAEAKLIINGLPENEADRLIKIARKEIERLENIFSIYLRTSSLSQLNSDGVLHAPPPELLSLFSIVSTLYRASDGKFDPTIQPFWAAYAEHKGQPSTEILVQAKQLVNWQNVRFDSNKIEFLKSGMAVTLNGIAQGFVTDRIVKLLKSEGLTSAIVNIGEIAAVGRNPQNDPWKIGLAEFSDEAAENHVSLIDQSVATSSASGTTFDGQRSHIIDPISGRSAISEWKRVSAIHNSAAIADGISTAAILMDENQIEMMLSEFNSSHIVAKTLFGKQFILKS